MTKPGIWECLGNIPEDYVADAMPPSWRTDPASAPRPTGRGHDILHTILHSGWTAAILSVVVAFGVIVAIVRAGREEPTKPPVGTNGESVTSDERDTPPVVTETATPAVAESETAEETTAATDERVTDAVTEPPADETAPIETNPTVPETIPDFDPPTDAPYRIDYIPFTESGTSYTAYITVNPQWKEPFDVVIPATADDGRPIYAIGANNFTPYAPMVIAQDTFDETILAPLEAYFGLSLAEALEIEYGQAQDDEARALIRAVQYFVPYDLADVTDEESRKALLEAHPLLAHTPLYVLDENAYEDSHTLSDISETLSLAGIRAEDIKAAYTELDALGGLPAGSTAATYDPQWKGRVNWGGMVRSVTLPDTLQSLERYAFAFCRNITEITLPDSVWYIGHGAFLRCEQLTAIDFPASLWCIANDAFLDCIYLSRVTFHGDRLAYIGSDAFRNCGLTEIRLPEGLERIGRGAFELCHYLGNVYLPATLTYIGGSAFTPDYRMIFTYGGTVAEWNATEKHKNWLSGLGKDNCVIHCTDGDIDS